MPRQNPNVPAILGAPSLTLEITLHRQLTFPKRFQEQHGLLLNPKDLAISGLYLAVDCQTLCCQFCNFEQSIEKFAPPHEGCANHEKNIPLALIPNWKLEAQRLLTFVESNFDFLFIAPEQLAKSGFYYVGPDDKCRCAFCKLDVSAWEEGDTADGEHRKFNRDCPFLNSPMEQHNVPIGREILDNDNDARVAQINNGARPVSPVQVKIQEELQA